MRINPISEHEASSQASAFRNWPRGIYDFEVERAFDKVSATGNDMIELVLKVYNKEGHSRLVYDYLVASEATAYKLRHFANTTGMLKQYEAGELAAEDCIGKSGQCQLYVKKDKKGQYPDKNAVSDYVPKVAGLAQSMPDDDLPF